MYADDTVLLFSAKTKTENEKAINHEAKLLHNWLCKNCLVVNPKQGKTEFLMFGTAANRSKIKQLANITFDSKAISNTGTIQSHG